MNHSLNSYFYVKTSKRFKRIKVKYALLSKGLVKKKCELNRLSADLLSFVVVVLFRDLTCIVTESVIFDMTGACFN